MKLRYYIVDHRGQLRKVRKSAVAALWDGNVRADVLGCREDNELRLVSVVIGVVLLLDAVVRDFVALTFPVDELALATNVQYVVMLAGLLSWFFWYIERHGLKA